MPPPRALKRSSWEKCAAGLFYDAAAEHVYTTSSYQVIFLVWQYLWGRGKHDPSRHLSPDRRTRMGRRKISTMLPITLKMRRNRTDKSSWKFRRVGSFVDKNDVKFWLVSSFVTAEFYIWTIAWDTKISLTMRANLRDNGKIWEILPTAYKVRPHFWAYAFWSSGKPHLPHCGCVLIVDAYSFVPPPAAVILPFSSSWSKN